MIYIIAGEPSGDFLGAGLIKSIKKTRPYTKICGVGGSLMKSEGLDSLFDISDISVGGFIEVIPHIATIKRLINKTISDILENNPKVLVTIDSPGFCFRVAKKIKKINPKIKLIHYVAPSVWAWREGRAKKLSKIYDHVLTLFDFEPKYFVKYGMKADFIGHSAVDTYVFHDESKRSRDVLILPGSRKQEIEKLLPVFLEAVYKKRHDFSEIIIPTFPHLVSCIEQYTKKYKDDIIIETDEKIKKNLFYTSKIAIAASGTVSLQLALAGCPMIVAYKMSGTTYRIIKNFVKVKYISLVNIILNKESVTELIQQNCVADKLVKAMEKIDSKQQMNDFLEIREKLRNNGANPSDMAASIVCCYLDDKF